MADAATAALNISIDSLDENFGFHANHGHRHLGAQFAKTRKAAFDDVAFSLDVTSIGIGLTISRS